MTQRIASVTLIVEAYDEAISYFVGTLGFVLSQDIPRPGGDRWVVVTPSHGGPGIRLVQAASAREKEAIGQQAGGRVFIVLYTQDLARDYALYSKRGVNFLEAPRTENYGQVAVFADPFGNRWDLIQPHDPQRL